RGDGGWGREPTDRHDLVSQRAPRFLLVRRPDLTQLVKHGGEQVEQSFQPLHILDHPDVLERQLIHVLRELGTEPTLAILHPEPELGLILNHLADLGIGEEITDLRLVVPLDDERLVKLGVAHLDVLHAQELAQVAEEVLPVDRESEALGIHVGGTHAGVGDSRLSARFGVRVQGHGQGTDMSLDLTSLPEPALDELSPDLLAKLPPHLVFAGTKPTHRLVSWNQVISRSIRLSHVFLDPSNDLPRQGLPIALGHLHDLHVRAILDIGDETTAPKSDARHEWDRSFE